LGLQNGAFESLRVLGDRDRNSKLLANGLVLAQDHLQDQAVDGVVAPQERDGTDDRLSKAVCAPLSLLVARWVPCQVVVDLDVPATALHQVHCDFLTLLAVLVAGKVLGEVLELGVDQREKRTERVTIATMRRCGHEEQVTGAGPA
jgi:hypothetical protein